MKFFGSIRLALSLLILLALAAIPGTLFDIGDGRYQNFYQHPLFRSLFALLFVNTLVCILRSVRRLLGEKSSAALPYADASVSQTGTVQVAGVDVAAAAKRIEAGGIRVSPAKGGFVVRTGRLGAWGPTLIHLSVLILMAGALLGEAGYVATLNMYPRSTTTHAYDWDLQAERELGFELRLDHFEPLYYPIELRIQLIQGVTGSVLEQQLTKEGDWFDLPLPQGRAKVERFSPLEELLELSIYRDTERLGTYRISREKGVEPGPLPPELILQPSEYRDPRLRQLRSEVSILEGGQIQSRQRIEINSPAEYEGVTIYQTAFERDDQGRLYAGFQFSKDPGKPLVWSGCVLMILGLMVNFLIPCRMFLLRERGSGIELVPVRGHRGTVPPRLVAKIVKHIQGDASGDEK